jgi:type VI secretion system protein ImpM
VSEGGGDARLGFYGKLPIRGDFMGRRLDRDFVDAWHGWIQECLAISREQLGDDWQSRYLAAPLWRFLIGPAICGASASAGVLMASADRVGRCFPLVFAVAVSRSAAPLRAMESARAWFEEIEGIALAALAEDLDPEVYDAKLRAIAPPPLASAPRGREHGFGIVLGEDKRISGLVVADRFLADLTETYSLWWTAGAPNFAPAIVAARGLPAPEGFSALLDGDWARWGWTTP